MGSPLKGTLVLVRAIDRVIADLEKDHDGDDEQIALLRSLRARVVAEANRDG